MYSSEKFLRAIHYPERQIPSHLSYNIYRRASVPGAVFTRLIISHEKEHRCEQKSPDGTTE